MDRVETHTLYQPEDVAPPQIFISSTFEPLIQQIRIDIKRDLEDLGYLPIMSELGTFVYRHGRAAVYDDTVEAVSASHIYVMVIGRRYGSKHPKYRKSITELEYEAARRRDLPTFVFVDQHVKDGFDAWRSGSISKDGHSHWVDDVKVWDLVQRVMINDACPVFFFSSAETIIRTLHLQIANLFGAYLRFEQKAKNWLWCEERTRQVERTSRTIWVLTPNFYWDYQDLEFRDIVFSNVARRGVAYRYLYRQTPENTERVEEMQRDYQAAMGEAWRDQVKFAAIPDKEFSWCTEQVMYDPGEPCERGIVVDAMDERDKRNKYNVELGREKRHDFRRHFQRLWAKYGEPAA
ncbi:MAG: DUF4062 domain-containing protein [Streptosporangiaceae bacterium]